MSQKKKTGSKKKKSQKSQGRTSSKLQGLSDAPWVVYVFFILVLGILAFSLYHDHVRNRPQHKEAAKKEKSDINKKQPVEKPRIVQDKRPKEPVTQKKSAQKPVETRPEQREDETLLPERLQIAKRSVEKMPEPREVEPLWPEERKPEDRKQPIKPSFFRPKVAVVIDDMGGSKKEALELFRVRANLTFSILPNQPYSAWVAEEGHKRGHNIIAHLPMEPKDSKKNLGEGGLYLSMSYREIQETFNRNIDSIPYVVGFNNHMGSAFTRDMEAMKTVMTATNGRHLFFLDSRTVPKSVGVAAAKSSGLRAFGRDVFLDHDNEPESIAKQWDELIEIAKEKGQAIAIGHPYDNTIAFLQKTLPLEEVEVVPVSELKSY